MAYINVDEFKRKLIDEKNFFPAIVARALDEMPTADVVPREEVEWLEKENARLLSLSEYDRSGIELDITDAKAEVARDIFAEIDLYCVDVLGEFDFYRFAELKKKYIGDTR